MRKDEMRDYHQRLLKLRGRLTDQIHKIAQSAIDKTTEPGELSHVPTHAADRESEGLERDIAVGRSHEEMLDAVDRAPRLIRIEPFGASGSALGTTGTGGVMPPRARPSRPTGTNRR